MIRGLAADSGFWRRLAHQGARHGPKLWVRYSPPFFGIAFAALLGRERAAVRRNLRLIRGQRSQWTETLDVFRTFASFASCLAESLAFERPEAKTAQCRVEGEQRLQQLLQLGRGVVLVTAHAGPWDAAARLLSQRLSAKVMLVMQREPDRTARALHDRVREQNGVSVCHVGKDAFESLALLRHLRRGGVVALQLDRSPSNHRHLQTTLFGRPFGVPEGPFKLAALSQAPILPLFAGRLDYYEYELFVGEPLWLARQAAASELMSVAGRATAQMEDFLRSHPTQWFHFRSE